jgi:hypothetical protein
MNDDGEWVIAPTAGAITSPATTASPAVTAAAAAL